MKILITGGHLTPALAIIDEIKRQDKKKEVVIIFVGRKYSLDSEKTFSLEYKEIMLKKIRFIPLQAGRLTRLVSLKSLRSFARFPLGFINSLKIILDEKPDVVMSFGGYLALPIVLWSWFMKIPIYTHEQTIQPGLANKIIAYFAKKVFVAFESSMNYFDKKKAILVGNPIRKSILNVQKKTFPVLTDKPVIYITGGSLGSHSINLHIADILENLLKRFMVIHQTGATKEYGNLKMMEKAAKKIPPSLRNDYIVREHFYENELGYVYSLADLVISRAGANTFFELLALEKPTIFIPLPWSSGGEQEKHAQLFEKVGCGKIFHQSQSSNQLLILVEEMFNDISKFKKNFSSLKHLYKKDVSRFIVSEIFPKI